MRLDRLDNRKSIGPFCALVVQMLPDIADRRDGLFAP